MVNYLTHIIIFLTDIYSNIFSDSIVGYYDYDYNNCMKHIKYNELCFFEKIISYLPSYFNHYYGTILYGFYLYKSDDVYYLSSLGKSKHLTPPILHFKIDNIDMKTQINTFCNNITLKYFFTFYKISPNSQVNIKYLKKGLNIKKLNVSEIVDYNLINLLT